MFMFINMVKLKFFLVDIIFKSNRLCVVIVIVICLFCFVLILWFKKVLNLNILRFVFIII